MQMNKIHEQAEKKFRDIYKEFMKSFNKSMFREERKLLELLQSNFAEQIEQRIVPRANSRWFWGVLLSISMSIFLCFLSLI